MVFSHLSRSLKPNSSCSSGFQVRKDENEKTPHRPPLPFFPNPTQGAYLYEC